MKKFSLFITTAALACGLSHAASAADWADAPEHAALHDANRPYGQPPLNGTLVNDGNHFYHAGTDPNDVHLFAAMQQGNLGKNLYSVLVLDADKAVTRPQYKARLLSGGTKIDWFQVAPFWDFELAGFKGTGTLYAYIDSNGDGICNEPVKAQAIDFTQKSPENASGMLPGHRIFLEDMAPAKDGSAALFTADKNPDKFILDGQVDTSLYYLHIVDTDTKQVLSSSGNLLEGGHSYDVTVSGKMGEDNVTYHVEKVWADQDIWLTYWNLPVKTTAAP